MSHIVAGLILIWPLVSDIFIKSTESYSSGKWQPWQSLIINPIQILLLIITIYLSSKNNIFTTLLIIINGALFLTLFPSVSTTTIIVTTILLLINSKKNLPQLPIVIPLIILTSQSLLAIAQFLIQSDLGLQFINEPELVINIKGIAKLGFPEWAIEILRSYGTFAHPNILSCIIGLSLIPILQNDKLAKNKKIIITLLASLGILASMSRNIIYLTIVITAYNYQKAQKLVIPIAILIITTVSIFGIRQLSPHTTISNHERIDQIVTTSTIKLKPWEQQPIHNIYLNLINHYKQYSLILIGLLILTIIKNENKKIPVTIIYLLAIGLTDHFLVTLPIANYALLLALTPFHQSKADITLLPSG